LIDSPVPEAEPYRKVAITLARSGKFAGPR
jgi:hypothetical protein